MKHFMLSSPGKFELSCRHPPAAFYRANVSDRVTVSIPMENALYTVTYESTEGRPVVHQLGSRDVLIVPAGLTYDIAWRRDADVVSFHMDETFIRNVTRGFEFELKHHLILRDTFVSTAAAQLRDMADAQDKPCYAFVDAIATLVAYRIGLCAASGRGVQSTRVEKALSKRQVDLVMGYIDQHLDSHITLCSLAEMLDMSTWHFVRRFTISQGIPPHMFIRQRRLSRAQSLLLESNMSITNVAMEVGMTHSHFSRSFFKRFGSSPREFRRVQRV